MPTFDGNFEGLDSSDCIATKEDLHKILELLDIADLSTGECDFINDLADQGDCCTLTDRQRDWLCIIFNKYC